MNEGLLSFAAVSPKVNTADIAAVRFSHFADAALLCERGATIAALLLMSPDR
ncbi:hypothetical protein [Sulfitobacter sp. SK011]|uniref:hypothetical protein n=1 Tax=Sulfitobacter sp. SK011 TaxID=1389004 RepID=UPI0013B47766|nr:hypothetical protein [Sulfitobacter sp. SK011]